jgi:hypothetical protein
VHQPAHHTAPARTRRVIHPDVLPLAVTLGAVFVLVWPIALAFGTGRPVRLPVLVAHTTGMLAGYGIVVLIGLMSRNPSLERGVGADRLARWHAYWPRGERPRTGSALGPGPLV